MGLRQRMHAGSQTMQEILPIKQTTDSKKATIATETNAVPDISVVVPTYQEAQNIPVLVASIADALAGRHYEIIVADDISDDGTDAVCAQLAQEHPVRLLSRHQNRGLAAAVIDGINLAYGTFVVVMDADLSHPPQQIPTLVAILQENRGDFVIGSRYIKGGKIAGNWPWWRRFNSWGATMLAKPLVQLADPMSGFFALARNRVPPPELLSSIGYKIGLEIIVKSGIRRIVETPIFFSERKYGKSKMTAREQINYIRHLRHLYYYRWPKAMEIVQFGIVGGIGFVWDTLFYVGLQAISIPHLWARAVAFWPGATSNWFLNRIITFSKRKKKMAVVQWAQFVIASLIGFVINWGTYALLILHVSFFKQYPFYAFIVGIMTGAIFNFVAADLLVFRRAK